MSPTGILPTRATVRSSRVAPSALPVLIAVPRIKTIRGDRRTENGEPPYRTHTFARRPATGRQPRRRLRRHVRLSACALLGLTPFGLAACLAASRQPIATSAPSVPARAVCDPTLKRICLSESNRRDALVDGRRTAAHSGCNATALSIEAASAANVPAAEAVVVLPGYLLPDNTRGEPVHEGS
jgi:hypothetical protein